MMSALYASKSADDASNRVLTLAKASSKSAASFKPTPPTPATAAETGQRLCRRQIYRCPLSAFYRHSGQLLGSCVRFIVSVGQTVDILLCRFDFTAQFAVFLLVYLCATFHVPRRPVALPAATQLIYLCFRQFAYLKVVAFAREVLYCRGPVSADG